MSKKSTFSFPELAIPAHLPPELAQRLGSKEGALMLAADLTDQREEVNSMAEERTLKRQIECARSVAAYHALRSDFLRALGNAEEDRTAALSAIKASRADAVQVQAEHERAVVEHREVLSRIESLNELVQHKTSAREDRVAHARKAFEESMLSSDEALQQQCAESLHKALSEHKAAEDEIQPLLLRVSGYETMEARAANVVQDLQPRLNAAQNDIRVAESNLALIDADVRTTEALIASIQAHLALNGCSPKRAPWGIGEAAFWISTARRAVRTNNQLPRMGADGPVLITSRPLQALIADAQVPDLSVFDAPVEA